MYHNKYLKHDKKVAQLFRDHWHNMVATAKRHGLLNRPYRIRQVCKTCWNGVLPPVGLEKAVRKLEDYKSVFYSKEAEDILEYGC